MAEEKNRFSELQKRFELLKKDSESRDFRNAEIIKELESKIEKLNESLDEFRSLASDSRNSLKEIKKSDPRNTKQSMINQKT